MREGLVVVTVFSPSFVVRPSVDHTAQPQILLGRTRLIEKKFTRMIRYGNLLFLGLSQYIFDPLERDTNSLKVFRLLRVSSCRERLSPVCGLHYIVRVRREHGADNVIRVPTRILQVKLNALAEAAPHPF